MNNKQVNKLVKENKKLKALAREGLEIAESYKKEAQYWKGMCVYLDKCYEKKGV